MSDFLGSDIIELGDYLSAVCEGYDRHAGLQTPTQGLLRGVRQRLSYLVPAGFEIAGSGGKGTATTTPWIGFFDPDETTSPEEGLYVVYLWGADLASVTLVLLQGITRLSRALGLQGSRTVLASEASAIRDELPSGAIADLSSSVDLGTSGFRQRAYSAACVVAKRYEHATLPAEAELRADLARFLALYQDAIEAKRRLAVKSASTTTRTAASRLDLSSSDLLLHFQPKSDADYVAHLEGREIVKSRRHERLIADYGRWAAEAGGFAASTREHPRDLVLRRGGEEWLVEGKILYRGNATDAVRAAVGQLLTYRHFFWIAAGASPPGLVGLFSEPAGDGYVDFLEGLGIAAVWDQSGGWHGSATAVAHGLAGGSDS